MDICKIAWVNNVSFPIPAPQTRERIGFWLFISNYKSQIELLLYLTKPMLRKQMVDLTGLDGKHGYTKRYSKPSNDSIKYEAIVRTENSRRAFHFIGRRSFHSIGLALLAMISNSTKTNKKNASKYPKNHLWSNIHCLCKLYPLPSKLRFIQLTI